MNKLLYLIGGGLIVGIAIALGWYFRDVPLLSPLNELTTFQFIDHYPSSSDGKMVYGFLPYWNIDDTQLHPQLTHLAYFSLTIAADGSILTSTGGELDPGYNHLQSDEFMELSSIARESGSDVEIVLSQFDSDDITSFLSSPTATDNLLQSLDSILLAYPVSGVNLDIEYVGETNDSLRQNLTQLVTTVDNHLSQTYNNVNLSIDMYAGAANNEYIWDVAAIAPHVDQIIIMAYDFHPRSSATAGPIAPLFGGKEYWDSDINQHLADFVKIVPRNKLLLGVPFYGYEWQTTSREAQAHTFPQTGATASYKRVQELLKQKEELQVEQHWNEHALAPYLSYIENDQVYVVYYEDSRSLSYKLDYVNQLDLGGIAIWALGYEGPSQELWEVIDQKL